MFALAVTRLSAVIAAAAMTASAQFVNVSPDPLRACELVHFAWGGFNPNSKVDIFAHVSPIPIESPSDRVLPGLPASGVFPWTLRVNGGSGIEVVFEAISQSGGQSARTRSIPVLPAEDPDACEARFQLSLASSAVLSSRSSSATQSPTSSQSQTSSSQLPPSVSSTSASTSATVQISSSQGATSAQNSTSGGGAALAPTSVQSPVIPDASTENTSPTAGAAPAQDPPKGKSSKTGAIAGGVVGGVVGLALLLLLALCLARRRRKRRELDAATAAWTAGSGKAATNAKHPEYVPGELPYEQDGGADPWLGHPDRETGLMASPFPASVAASSSPTLSPSGRSPKGPGTPKRDTLMSQVSVPSVPSSPEGPRDAPTVLPTGFPAPPPRAETTHTSARHTSVGSFSMVPMDHRGDTGGPWPLAGADDLAEEPASPISPGPRPPPRRR